MRYSSSLSGSLRLVIYLHDRVLVFLKGLVPERVNAKRCPKCYSACGLFFTDVTISRQQKASEIISEFPLFIGLYLSPFATVNIFEVRSLPLG